MLWFVTYLFVLAPIAAKTPPVIKSPLLPTNDLDLDLAHSSRMKNTTEEVEGKLEEIICDIPTFYRPVTSNCEVPAAMLIMATSDQVHWRLMNQAIRRQLQKELYVTYSEMILWHDIDKNTTYAYVISPRVTEITPIPFSILVKTMFSDMKYPWINKISVRLCLGVRSLKRHNVSGDVQDGTDLGLDRCDDVDVSEDDLVSVYPMVFSTRVMMETLLNVSTTHVHMSSSEKVWRINPIYLIVCVGLQFVV